MEPTWARSSVYICASVRMGSVVTPVGMGHQKLLAYDYQKRICVYDVTCVHMYSDINRCVVRKEIYVCAVVFNLQTNIHYTYYPPGSIALAQIKAEQQKCLHLATTSPRYHLSTAKRAVKTFPVSSRIPN